MKSIENECPDFLHLTDIHFGRNFPFSKSVHNDSARTALQHLLDKLKPALIVITGDLTQRARISEFEEARTWLDSLNIPYLVIPGNHDIVSYWFPMKRLFRPLSHFQEIFELPATYQTIKGPFHFYTLRTVRQIAMDRGWITRQDWIKFLRLHPEKPLKSSNDIKILLTHHPLYPESHATSSSYVLNYRRYLPELARWGFQIFLSGHTHIPALTHKKIEGKTLTFNTCASSLSNRYRARFAEQNMVIHYKQVGNGLQVQPYTYHQDTRYFVAGEENPCFSASPSEL